MKKSFLLTCLFILVIFLFSSCGTDINPNEIEDVIASVENGNTIKLNNGLTVHLNGLKRKNKFTEKLLENYIGQRVSLMLDKTDEGFTIKEFYEEEVNCYVTIVETGEELNEILLSAGGEKAFDKSHCQDHLDKYKKLVEDNDKEMDSPTLCALMRSASMLVYAGDKEQTWIGTAFFIGKDGLALTNHHVLNNQTNAYVFLSDSQGNVDTNQPFKVKRIVSTDPTYDYTIFYVDLDPTALQRLSYLKLARERNENFVGGLKVAAIGNPAPGNRILTMSYAAGEIGGIREDQGKIQVNVAVTHGFSGGPTCNFKGQVVGITQGGYEHNDANLNFAVDIRLVRNKLDELLLPYAGK